MQARRAPDFKNCPNMFKIGINSIYLQLMFRVMSESSFNIPSTPEEFSYSYTTIDAHTVSLGNFVTDGGAICLCTCGTAELMIGANRTEIREYNELVLLADTKLFIFGCSEDFRMAVFRYSRQMAFQATRKIDPVFFRHIRLHPVYRNRNSLVYEDTLSYLKILATLSEDVHNRFNVIIATNLLRCKMLNIYDKILRDYPVEEGHVRSRKEEIFDRFISMINERGQSHRDVAYYASRLCISSRYLCSIVREVASEQPKEIIDRHLVMEIKLLLTFSDLSIQQIADRLEFPDQSYMGRFFRRATGMSPLAYRKNEITM